MEEERDKPRMARTTLVRPPSPSSTVRLPGMPNSALYSRANGASAAAVASHRTTEPVRCLAGAPRARALLPRVDRAMPVVRSEAAGAAMNARLDRA
jgi:hypothetical protein